MFLRDPSNEFTQEIDSPLDISEGVGVQEFREKSVTE